MGHWISSTYWRIQQKTKHNAVLKVQIWLVKKGGKINHGLCEKSKINTKLGFGFPWQGFQQKALVIARDSLFLAIVLLSKNIYSFGMNCFPRDLPHRNCRRTEMRSCLWANLTTALRIGFHWQKQAGFSHSWEEGTLCCQKPHSRLETEAAVNVVMAFYKNTAKEVGVRSYV